MKEKPFHEKVAEKLIEQLKSGTAPWQRPWHPGDPNALLPVNPTTGNRYKGINAIQLMSENREDNRWLTYKQASSMGAQVRKGEKGTPVQYWKFYEEQPKRNDKGDPIIGNDGQVIKETVKLERPRVFMAVVFNAQQINGMPPLENKENNINWNAHERAELILKASGANFTHSEGYHAHYFPSKDTIEMPAKHQFSSADDYYATVLHELGHWTGHSSRLDRDLTNPFGSENYAKEELRAEIASMIIGQELNIGYDPHKHVSYVSSWIKALQDDSFEIFRAAADAEKIQNYVLSFENQQILSDNLSDHDVSEVLNNPDVTFDHFEAFQGESLESTLRAHGLNTIENVTGKNSSNYFDTAIENLSPVFGISVDYEGTDNAYLERKGLAQQFTTQAEEIYLTHNNTHNVNVTEEPKVNNSINNDEKTNTYIKVPYKEKEEAKELGAKWDRKEQSWYVPASVELDKFEKWKISSEKSTENNNRTYLAVPYGERELARSAGAKWDKTAKSWYVGPNADTDRLNRWLPDNALNQQSPALTPVEEFSEALRTMGCIVTDGHPIMDGKKHRIPAENDKPGEKAGFYVGHLDGHPAGYIKNNRTGLEMKWKSKGYSLDPQEKAKLKAEAAKKLTERTAELKRTQEEVAQQIKEKLKTLVQITETTQYLQNKGVQAHTGALTDSGGKKTYIPAQDVNGKVWTMQYINENGIKRFAKDSKKEGCFHVIGGMEALAIAPAIVVGEGYATAASNTEALGFSTVAAFDSGNLPYVVKALHDKYPDKPVIVAGDDDLHLEMTHGINPGRTKAEAAAKEVGGKAVFPIFAPKEKEYPAALAAITPKAFRNNELTGEQLSALNRIKEFTDYNDMATKSELGKEGVKRQLKSAVSLALNKYASIGEENNLEVKHIKKKVAKIER